VPRTLVLAATDGAIEVAFREHRRSRRLRLHVRDGEVLLTAPPRTPQTQIDRFLIEHRAWVERTLAQQRLSASALGLRRPGVVWRLGRPIPVAQLGIARTESAIERWYRDETRRVAAELVACESPVLGVRVTRLRIGDQRSRWGSASSRGTVSLNWRLLLAPLEVLDYVVVHELCHLRELNHSQRFWKLVASARPGYAQQKRWLDRHGAELRAWQPADALVLPEILQEHD
jgi:predicted metal-dependent hydrolase